MTKLKKLLKNRKAQICAIIIGCGLIAWHYWPFVDAAL